MGAALIGLVGVVLGVVGSVVVARWTASAAEAAASAGRREERIGRVRELAADAYVEAVEAVAWLSGMHVEDSVDPRFADTYVPNTERAVAQLRAARRALDKAAALSGDGALAASATETARLLGVLDGDWHGCQEYRKRLLQQARTEPTGWASEAFNRHYDGLVQSRAALTGFGEHTLPRDKTRQGSVAEGSALHRRRRAIAAS